MHAGQLHHRARVPWLTAVCLVQAWLLRTMSPWALLIAEVVSLVGITSCLLGAPRPANLGAANTEVVTAVCVLKARDMNDTSVKWR